MSLERAVNPTTPGMSPALVERIVDLARRRVNAALRATRSVVDCEVRWTRLAELHEREARWWGVLLRYTSPYSPYYAAVLATQAVVCDRAQNYRRYVAEAVQDRADAARRAADRASERVA
jgi:hypothetical protein